MEYNDEYLEKIYKRLYKSFFLEIDATDNGVSQAKETRYNINTSLSMRVSRYNKSWISPETLN